MATIGFTVRLDNSSQQQAVVEVIARHLNNTMNRAVLGIQEAVKQRVTDAFERSPEYASIQSGELWHELGIEQPNKALTSLLNALTDSIHVVNRGVRSVGGQLQGGLSVEILRRDLSEVLTLPEASYVSLNRYGQTHRVDWLEWLLTGGEDIVLADYRYVGVDAAASRTDVGIMVHSRRKGWGVPSEFAGTIDDNWLTRALATVMPDLLKIFEQEIEKVI